MTAMNEIPRYSSTPGKPSPAQITSSQKGTPIASNVAIANINWQASTAVENAVLLTTLVKCTFDGGTTPGGVQAGQVATFTGTTNIANKGSYRIVISDSTTITITNKQRTNATPDETGSPGTVTIYNPTFVTIFDSSTSNVYLEAINICTDSPQDVSVLFKLEQASPSATGILTEITVPALTGMNGQAPINLLSMANFPSQKISGGLVFPSGYKIIANAVIESTYSINFIPIFGDYAVIS